MNETPKRPRGRPKTLDRQRTVERAMDTYWRAGVHALSLNEVCRRVDISKPAMYREFGDEDGLMLAALEHYRSLVVQPVLDAVVLDLPFAVLVGKLIEGMTAEHNTPPGCLFTEMRLARSRLGPKCLAQLRAMEEERVTAFERWFLGAVERGEVDGSLPGRLAARYIDTQFATVLAQLGMGVPADEVKSQAELAMRALQA